MLACLQQSLERRCPSLITFHKSWWQGLDRESHWARLKLTNLFFTTLFIGNVLVYYNTVMQQCPVWGTADMVTDSCDDMLRAMLIACLSGPLGLSLEDRCIMTNIWQNHESGDLELSINIASHKNPCKPVLVCWARIISIREGFGFEQVFSWPVFGNWKEAEGLGKNPLLTTLMTTLLTTF